MTKLLRPVAVHITDQATTAVRTLHNSRRVRHTTRRSACTGLSAIAPKGTDVSDPLDPGRIASAPIDRNPSEMAPTQ